MDNMQMNEQRPASVTAKAKTLGLRVMGRVRRIVVGSVAVVVMMLAYGVSTLGSIGTSALGITSAATVATLAASSTPASARHWRRRRRYYGYPYRRRRRRRSGVYFWF